VSTTKQEPNLARGLWWTTWLLQPSQRSQEL